MSGTPLRVVLVEDSAADAALEERELRRHGFALDLRVVDTEDAFRRALDAAPPDLVLADYSLPTFDGMRALRIVLEREPAVPVIIVTGSLNEETAVECIKAGASDYVLKDRLARLGPAVTSALEHARTRCEREAALTALAASEERLRLALRAANQGFYDLDVQTGEAIVNDEYALMLGYDPATFVETNESWVERLHPDDREPVAATYRAYVAGELPEYRVEFRQRTADGAWRWILSVGKVVERDASGAPLRMLGTHVDITERREAERERERLLADLREREERLRLLAGRLAESEEAERRRIARELHDRVGQNLVALNLNVSVIRSQLSESSLARVSPRLDDVSALVGATAQEIRAVIADLHPAVLADYGLHTALRWMASELADRSGLDVEAEGDEVEPRPAPAVEAALFRIAQEAVTNAVRHARARRVRVAIEAGADTVRLRVADDGCGFDPVARPPDPERPRYGLASMRERAEAVGGTLAVDSASGRGTVITAEVPR